ncbi:MAG TPA: flagellar hook-basal body complex protein FliE, partial [Bacillota bacterium]|nr:flagellar hook-basal body complex protein FliE [Bacillota bacterium]
NTENKSAQKVLTDSFGSFLKDALSSVNQAQLEAEEVSVRVALKDPTVELHDLTIAAQKAAIALDITLAIKDRLIEGYKEIMRMQV